MLTQEKLQEYKQLEDYIMDAHRDKIEKICLNRQELEIVVLPKRLEVVVRFLRDDINCSFTELMDVCGVDFPSRDKRFDVVYHLLSMKHNRRIRIKVAVADEGSVPSLVGMFKSAGWFERETFDLFGIYFDNHPDLRRILTDYGFDGHPLRKDFPLTGHVEMRYDTELKRIVYEPVKLRQEFRNFDFMSPWEGMTGRIEADYKAGREGLLPGDEKAFAFEKAANGAAQGEAKLEAKSAESKPKKVSKG